MTDTWLNSSSLNLSLIIIKSCLLNVGNDANVAKMGKELHVSTVVVKKLHVNLSLAAWFRHAGKSINFTSFQV
jgi:hypothetical protein